MPRPPVGPRVWRDAKHGVDAGVAEDSINASATCTCLGRETSDVVLIGDVAYNTDPPSGSRNPDDTVVPVGSNDLLSKPGEVPPEGRTNATRGAGHDR